MEKEKTPPVEEHIEEYGDFNNIIQSQLHEQVVGFEGFRIITLKAGEDYKTSATAKNKFFFLTKGSGSYVIGTLHGTLHTDAAIMAPYDRNFQFHCLDNCEGIMLTFSALLPEHNQFLQQLYQKAPHHDIAYQPLLPLTEPLLHFGQGIQAMIRLRHVSPWYTKMKRRELFYMICAVYPAMQVLSYFQPLLKQTDSFRTLVLNHADNVNNAQELIAAIGCGRTNFYRQFTDEFGIPVHKWLQQRTAKRVRELANYPDITVARLMHETGFSTPSNFIRFTRQFFGCTPLELIKTCRKNRFPEIKEEE